MIHLWGASISLLSCVDCSFFPFGYLFTLACGLLLLLGGRGWGGGGGGRFCVYKP